MKNVCVIGGGAAGMMAAGVAASRGLSVTLFEKNNKLGSKLYITGKGRCNITNDCDAQTFLDNVVSNHSFLYSAAYTFDTSKTIEFFNNLGVATKVERGSRVFPASDKASDVVKALERFVKKNGVNVRLGCGVKEITETNGKITGVVSQNGKQERFDCVIVATGGLSYPATGSTGDGYNFARSVGHTVTKLFPSLTPLRTYETFVSELSGLSLKNVGIEVFVGGKSVYTDFGEMLFTHIGISGPIILSASGYLHNKFDKKPTIAIDLKPALTEAELDKRLLKDFAKFANKDLINALDELLPKKLIPVIIEASGIEKTKKVNVITKDERKQLVKTLKAFTITIKGATGFNDAIITKGGVCVDEINPSTMQSKKVSGLFFVGEVLDLDAYTGGFNLQIAFATAYVAGTKVCK